MWTFKPKITEQQARKELYEMVEAYNRKYTSGRSAFLTGSSLVGNKNGDSARYWELKEILKGYENNKS